MTRRLIFRDDLTEDRLDVMRDHLAEALLASDRVELELMEINEADEAFVNLICGAHRVAESLGKSISLSTIETRNTVNGLARKTGYATLPCFMRSRGCLYEDE